MKVYKLRAQFLWNVAETYYINARNKEQAKKKFLDNNDNYHKTKKFLDMVVDTYKQECGVDPRESVSRTKKLVRVLERNRRYALSICVQDYMTKEV